QGFFELEGLDEHAKIQGSLGEVELALGLIVVGLDVLYGRGGKKGDVAVFGHILLGLEANSPNGNGCEDKNFFHGQIRFW
ncbi:MAG: hypothetical protein EBZ48_17760, partial [Proteobacteria bacterium]|nr:hypothetical protein [Pseudomonadota bacterium]